MYPLRASLCACVAQKMIFGNCCSTKERETRRGEKEMYMLKGETENNKEISIFCALINQPFEKMRRLNESPRVASLTNDDVYSP